MRSWLDEARQHERWSEPLWEQFQTIFEGLAEGKATSDTMTLGEWKAALVQVLALPNCLFHASADMPTQRQAAHQALQMLIMMIGDLPGGHALGDQDAFGALLDFLDDLNRGRKHRWADTGAARGGTKDTSAEEAMWTRLIVAIEVLKIDGHTTAEAVRIVSGSFSRRRGPEAIRLPASGTITERYAKFEIGQFQGEFGVVRFINDVWRGKGSRPFKCPHSYALFRCEPSGGGKCSNFSALTTRWAKHLAASL